MKMLTMVNQLLCGCLAHSSTINCPASEPRKPLMFIPNMAKVPIKRDKDCRSVTYRNTGRAKKILFTELHIDVFLCNVKFAKNEVAKKHACI